MTIDETYWRGDYISARNASIRLSAFTVSSPGMEVKTCAPPGQSACLARFSILRRIIPPSEIDGRIKQQIYSSQIKGGGEIELKASLKRRNPTH